ncbi:TLD-domain-containing protein [Fennellomyces sp. T-0311]|nr:TLD-domain-containing protein [Fennellomyces sp. T-0311]
MMKVSTLPSILVNTAHIPNIAVVDTSPIQCTQFYYYEDGGGKDDVVPTQSSSSNLSRHLQLYHKNRKPLRRSSTGLFSSLSLTSNSSSDDDDEVRQKSRDSVISKERHDRPAIRLTRRDTHTWTCLNNRLAEKLRNFLPSRVAVCSQWPLLYSMDQHGSSLQTMYYRIGQYQGPCMLVIQTTDDEIFGVYISEPLQIQSRYYGSGECFLWRLEDMHDDDQQPEIYRWTGKNDYLIYSGREYVSVGGGDGRVAIWLNEDLLQGYTEPCATFDNKPLTTRSNFECLALEIWGIQF